MMVKVLLEPPRQRGLHAFRWTLLALGMALLGYCGWIWYDAHRFEARSSRTLEEQTRPGAPPSVEGRPVPPPNDLIGRLEIPRLNMHAVVQEGVDSATLRRAVGHVPGTALPGQIGNVGLAAHRDGLFRGLKDVRKHDRIELLTPSGAYAYSVESTEIVTPSDVAVLAKTDGPVLTLVTCYPFYYVGNAPKRFIVRARQIAASNDLRLTE